MHRTLSLMSLSLLLAACTGDITSRPDRPEPPTADDLAAHRFCEQGETVIQGSFNDTAEILLESCQPESQEVPALLRLRERRSRLILQQQNLRLAVPNADIHWYLDGYVTYANGDEEARFDVPNR